MNLSMSDLRELLCPTISPSPAGCASPLGGTLHKIVVADKGFVLAGDVRAEGEYIIIENCVCIRYWGTPTNKANDSGLGFLAKNGVQADTKLDPQPTTRIHKLQVVQMIDCVREIRRAS